MSNLAVVTGGSRGIGRAIVERLAKDGFDVLFTYRSNEAEAAAVVEACKEFGTEVKGVKADVASHDDCKEIAAAVKERSKELFVLVNNAGITKDGLLIGMKDEDFNDVIDVNLRGTYYMMRELTPMMLRNRKGRVINISSVSGVLGNAGQANYSASKAGVIGLTKATARELAGKNICINAVAPGMIGTDMVKAMTEDAQKSLAAGIPMKRIGNPEEIAGVVSFLASEDSTYITGQVINVDGGMAI